eukprot:GHVL01039902.1.p1 GENE.GHVL01039902.1~~GHVL01039902.1.p1  ORF type:complete len:199 (-),score=60.40 GHVL01039902.1:92-688(-)
MMKKNMPIVVFVLGGPGSGKGTQCLKISDRFNFKHISAGECLRDEINVNSEYSKLIKLHMSEGRIVPVEITVNLLKNKMIYYGLEDGRFLIDGFPRNMNNVEGWYKIMNNICNDIFCIFIKCDEKTMEERLLNRGISSNRIDDNIDSIKKRFRTFMDDTMPVVNMYKKMNKLKIVNGENEPDVVWEEIKLIFQNSNIN